MTVVANDTPEAEAARVLIDRQMLDYRTAVPGVVVRVAADGTTVDVRPAVDMSQTLDGQTRGIPMPVLTGVPLAVLGSAALGLFVCVPVAVGDDGLLVVCDRAIDNWQHGAGTAMTPTGPSPRHHDLTDAVFLPGLQRASGAIAGYPTDAIQVRNRAGTVRLAVSDTGVDILGNVTVDGDITATGLVTDSGGISLAEHKHSGIEPGGGTSGGITA